MKYGENEPGKMIWADQPRSRHDWRSRRSLCKCTRTGRHWCHYPEK